MGTALNAFMAILALLLLVVCIGAGVSVLLWLAFNRDPRNEYKNDFLKG